MNVPNNQVLAIYERNRFKLDINILIAAPRNDLLTLKEVVDNKIRVCRQGTNEAELQSLGRLSQLIQKALHKQNILTGRKKGGGRKGIKGIYPRASPGLALSSQSSRSSDAEHRSIKPYISCIPLGRTNASHLFFTRYIWK